MEEKLIFINKQENAYAFGGDDYGVDEYDIQHYEDNAEDYDEEYIIED